MSWQDCDKLETLTLTVTVQYQKKISDIFMPVLLHKVIKSRLSINLSYKFKAVL